MKYHKKLIILLIFSLILILITVNSISAIEIDSNDTSTNDEGFLEVSEDSKISNLENNDNLSSYSKYMSIKTNNYDDFKNTEPLRVQVDNTGYCLYYEIYDNNNSKIYSRSHGYIFNKGIYNFSSNSYLFKDLPDGIYKCKLSLKTENGVTKLGYSTDWNVVKSTVKDNPSNIVYSSGDSTIKSEDVKTLTPKSNHYVKYIKVNKYKIKVWSDDSFKVQKQKVLKYLRQHIKKPHIYKVAGYKFKVSAKMYANILFYKKYGKNAGDINIFFESKTNKYKTLKVPVYKTKKIAHYKWAYKYIIVGKSYYKNGIYHYKYYNKVGKYYDNGWKYQAYASAQNSGGGYNDYAVIKKKVKYYTYIDDISYYKKVKCRVYAYGGHSSWKPYVVFRGVSGNVNQLINGVYYRI